MKHLTNVSGKAQHAARRWHDMGGSNMKRWKVAALAAVLALGLVGNAWASEHVANHLQSDGLRFRRHAAAIVSPVDFLGGYIDSSATSGLGATGACPLDTTTAISTDDWPQLQNQALSDTSGFVCQLVVSDAGASSAGGADSASRAMPSALPQPRPHPLSFETLAPLASGERLRGRRARRCDRTGDAPAPLERGARARLGLRATQRRRALRLAAKSFQLASGCAAK